HRLRRTDHGDALDGSRSRVALRHDRLCALSRRYGWTTTRVPTGTRSYKAITSAFTSRKQPDEMAWPIVCGWLVPWMRYTVLPRYIARAPSGLPGPPAMKRGR